MSRLPHPTEPRTEEELVPGLPGEEEVSEPPEPAVERGFLRPRTLISFAIAFAVLIFFVRGVDLDFAEIWARIRGSNPLLLLLALVVYYQVFIGRALRWRVLLENVGYSRAAGRPMPSVLGLAEIIYLSFFTNCVVPARLGDAYRGYMLKRTAGVSFSTTLGTILAERLIDLAVLAGMMATAALITFRGALPDEANRALVGGLVLTGIGLAGLVAMPRLRPLVERLLPERFHRHYAGLESGILGSFRRIPLVLTFSVINWLLEGLTLYLVAAAVGVPVSVGAAIVVALVASLLSTVPFTPAGLGVAEAGIVLLLTQLGIEKNAAGAIGLLDRLITYWSIVVFGAVVYVVSRKK